MILEDPDSGGKFDWNGWKQDRWEKPDWEDIEGYYVSKDDEKRKDEGCIYWMSDDGYDLNYWIMIKTKKVLKDELKDESNSNGNSNI